MVLKKEIFDQIKDLLQKNPHGLKITDIVKVIAINRNTAGRYLETLLVSGQVEMRRLGMAKIYKISQRVPLSAVLSISSELVVQLDSHLRIVFANEPFCRLTGTDSRNLVGKNIEYTPVALVFDELFTGFIERIREGIAGHEWSGEINLNSRDCIMFCRVAPTVFENGQKGVSVLLDDITRQKQGERALLESEAIARALINAPTDSVILIDDQGIILAVNENAASRLGKRSDELVGIPAYDLLPKEVAQRRRSLMAPILEKKEMVRFIDERDSTWYDTVAYPILNETGDVKKIAIIARDITDRQKSEEALRESEERYRQLVEISPDAVIIHQEGKITFLNPAALAMLGVKDENEILGKNVLEIIHPDYRDAVRKNIENDLGGNITQPIELPLLRVDGSSVIVEGRGIKTTIHGKPAIQVAIRDITERKRVELELRENERRLQLLLDSTEDLIFMQDPEGRYVYFNATERLGVPQKDILGMTPYELLDKEAANRIVERVKTVVKTGQRIREETSLTWKGETLWFSDSLSPVRDDNSTIVAVVTISHNITERKRAEMALRESEQIYLRLLEQSFDAIAIHKDKKIAFLNERAAKILGADRPEDLIGRSIFQFIHPDSRKDLEDRIQQINSEPDKPAPVMREKFFRMDGTLTTVDVIAIRFNDNGVPAIKVAFREVRTG
jgi:PAS domain S-box-containing protein